MLNSADITDVQTNPYYLEKLLNVTSQCSREGGVKCALMHSDG